MKIDSWLTVREATDIINLSRPEGCRPISTSQVRRRLYHIDSEGRARGGGILKWVSSRRVLVSAEALLRELRTDPNAHETALSEFDSRQCATEIRLQALRNVVRSLKRELRRKRSGQ